MPEDPQKRLPVRIEKEHDPRDTEVRFTLYVDRDGDNYVRGTYYARTKAGYVRHYKSGYSRHREGEFAVRHATPEAAVLEYLTSRTRDLETAKSKVRYIEYSLGEARKLASALGIPEAEVERAAG